MPDQIFVSGLKLNVTPVYDAYWQFACERQDAFFRRLRGDAVYTRDNIIARFRFTNAYRALDRVSQYLIRCVIPDSHSVRDTFFRILLFKIFNKIETWELLSEALGPLHADNLDWKKAEQTLRSAMLRGESIYSAAYIMPSPHLGGASKHENHLNLLRRLLDEGIAEKWAHAKSLRSLYEMMLRIPSFGKFLAFQYAIDLNYGDYTRLDEDGFVVAGPGALDGISKCFVDTKGLTAETIIAAVTERQGLEFAKRGQTFRSLYGRPLKRIDCQNLFCEISKYSRLSHPQYTGISGRTKIKQSYRPLRSSYPAPTFPDFWGLRRDEGLEQAVPYASLV